MGQNTTIRASKWVETTLAQNEVDEKIGQLLFTTYHGSLTPTMLPLMRRSARRRDLPAAGSSILRSVPGS